MPLCFAGKTSLVRLFLVVLFCGGCRGDADAVPPLAHGAQSPATAARPAETPARDAASDAPLVVFLGDSIAAGLRVAQDEAFPAVIERRLAEAHHPIRLVNAGVSGDTTAGGARRLDWVLKQKPDVLVVELGANDGLRGLALDSIESSLREIIVRAKQAGARVLLLGMRLPTNYGEAYADAFAQIYPRLAQEQNVAFVPFFMQKIGGIAELNQADGLHPTAHGHELLADTALPELRKLIEAPRANR